MPAESADLQMMDRALALARRAAGAGEVPVGALVVQAGAILGRGWNRPIGAADPTAHAEINALRRAASRTGNYRLTGATLYVTLEPCLMCMGALVHARIGRLVYGAADPKVGAASRLQELAATGALNHRPKVSGGVRADRCRELLREYFRARR